MRAPEIPTVPTASVAAVVIACALVRGAWAQDAVEPLGLAYQAPAGCPEGEAFFREITERTSRVRLAKPGEAARKLHVVITKHAGAFVGRLSVEDLTSRSSTREVTDATCGEVVRALALVAALAVDPSASLTRLSADEAGRPVTSTPAAPAPAASAPPDESIQKSVEPISAPPAASIDAQSSPRLGPLRYSAGVEVESAAIGDAVFSARIFGDVEPGHSRGFWTPSLRLALGRSLDVERQASSGRATLHFTQATLELCPLRAAITPSSGVRPCFGVSGGVLDARGNNVDNAHAISRPWVTASTHVRLEWVPISAFGLELDAGAIAPIYRDSYYFKHVPNVAVYQAPPLGFVARLGLRVRFP